MASKTGKLIAATTLALVFTPPVLAAEPGFYLTATMGQAEEDPKSAGTNVSFGIPSFAIVHLEPDDVAVDASDFSWGVGLGYRINSYLAAELEYLDFGTTDVAEHYDLEFPGLPFPSELTLDYSSRVTGPAVSLLGSLPLGKHFSVFLRGGLLFADREISRPQFGEVSEVTSGDEVWLGGAGVDWTVASRWQVRAEFQRTGKLEEAFFVGGTQLERISLSAIFKL
jgi:hypothetical protein